MSEKLWKGELFSSCIKHRVTGFLLLRMLLGTAAVPKERLLVHYSVTIRKNFTTVKLFWKDKTWIEVIVAFLE